MGKRRDDWVDVFRALGEAFLGVLRAEWDVLSRRWQATLRSVAYAAACFTAAGLFAVVLLALLVAAAVFFVEDYFDLETWQATLAVAGAVLVVVLSLAAVGRFVYLRRFENPAATARERLADHVRWWHERLLDGERALPEAVAPSRRDSQSEAKPLLEGDDDGEPDDETAASGSRPAS